MTAPILIDETEAAFQARLIEYALSRGWEWMHIGRTGKYTANGAKGTLGTGWPDLTMVRGTRLIFAELKAQRAPIPGAEQQRVLLILSDAAEVYHWRPSDWPMILEVLL
jgi:hypothetical protein